MKRILWFALALLSFSESRAMEGYHFCGTGGESAPWCRLIHVGKIAARPSKERQFFWARRPAELKALHDILIPAELPHRGVDPVVDFERSIVLAVVSEPLPGSGYEIRLGRPVYEGRVEGGVRKGILRIPCQFLGDGKLIDEGAQLSPPSPQIQRSKEIGNQFAFFIVDRQPLGILATSRNLTVVFEVEKSDGSSDVEEALPVPMP